MQNRETICQTLLLISNDRGGDPGKRRMCGPGKGNGIRTESNRLVFRASSLPFFAMRFGMQFFMDLQNAIDDGLIGNTPGKTGARIMSALT